MVSDKLLQFSEYCWDKWLTIFGVGLLAALAAIPLLVLGWFVALITSTLTLRHNEPYMEHFLMWTFGPCIAAFGIVVGPLALVTSGISFVLGYLVRGIESCFGYLQQRERAIQQQREQNLRALEQDRAQREAARPGAVDHRAMLIRLHQQVYQHDHKEGKADHKEVKAAALGQAERKQEEKKVVPVAAVGPLDEQEQLKNQINRLRDLYNGSLGATRQEHFKQLRDLYNQYNQIFILDPLPDVKQIIDGEQKQRNADGEQKRGPAPKDETEQKHLDLFRRIFPPIESTHFLINHLPDNINPLLKKAPHVLDAPLTKEQLAGFAILFEVQKGDSLEEQANKIRNQRIFRKAMEDEEITFELMKAPVRVPDGRTYDLATVADFPVAANGLRATPDNAKHFKMEDLVPNNTLGRAIKCLLTSMTEGAFVQYSPNESVKQMVQDYQKDRKQLQDSKSKTVFFNDDDVRKFAAYHRRLIPRRKALFDIMCRDPLTGQIFQDPVYLPDGYTYERVTILALLAKSKKEGKKAVCPFAKFLSFNEDDIQVCFTTRNVMDQVKTEILAIEKLVGGKPQSAQLDDETEVSGSASRSSSRSGSYNESGLFPSGGSSVSVSSLVVPPAGEVDGYGFG